MNPNACALLSFTLMASVTSAGELDLSSSDIRLTPLQASISSAIDKFELTNHEHWAYQVSRFENEEGDITQTEEAFDGSLPAEQRWQLVSLNQQVPSEREKQQYTKSKQDDSASVSLKLRQLVELDSVTMVTDTPEYSVVSFDVNLAKLGNHASQSLAGVLTLNKGDGYIETLTITNTQPFSPLFGAKIENFNLTFDFTYIQNAVLPLEQKMTMKGRFAIFTDIEETSSDSFSHFRYVGP